MIGSKAQSRSGHARGGFAMVVAITLMGLVAATLAVLATLLVSEAKRTGAAATEAQLRQLLIAGEAVAAQQTQKLVETNGKDQIVALPQELAEGKASLALKSSRNREGVDVIVTAKYQGREATQTLRFARRGAGWELADARLGS